MNREDYLYPSQGKFNSRVFSIVKQKRISYLETKTLTLHFKDETTHTIALSEMNFNGTDKASLLKEINSRLPKIEETEQKV